MEEKVSVIMAVYKETREELIQSINSILNQTYKNFEFIIIIDNPNDSWRKTMIEKINDARIKIIFNEENMGLSKSLNRGLKIAQGTYIARMDADDIAFPSRLEKQKEFIEKEKYDLCGCNYIGFIDDNYQKYIINPQRHRYVTTLLKYINCIGHPTWFAKKEVFDLNNGYRDIHSCEDYDFLLRALEKNITVGNVQEFLLKYRLNENSISRKNAGKQILISNYLRKCYKKNKSLSKQEIDEYLCSKTYDRKLKYYNKYYDMQYKKNLTDMNISKKIYYLLYMSMHINLFCDDVLKKVLKKIILYKDKKLNRGKK